MKSSSSNKRGQTKQLIVALILYTPPAGARKKKGLSTT